MAKNTAVFAIFKTHMEVENAVEQLRTEGFRSEDISVLLPNNEGTKDLGVMKGTKAPEGLSTGAVSGAVVGGAFGWLTGIGALAIPGIGPFIVAGPSRRGAGGRGSGRRRGRSLGRSYRLGDSGV